MASDFLKKKAQEQQQQLLLAQGYERIGKGTGTASDFLRRKAAEQAAADIQKEQERQQRNAGWFKGSTAFDDGWQFGDLTKTVAGTLQDVENDLRAGALGILEGTIDAGAYLVGGAGKLLGADAFADKVSGFIQKDLIDEEKIANMNLMTKLIGGGDAVEDYSIFGDKMDSVVQSGGQMLGQIGLQGVGIPWWVTSGVTSFGGQVEQALNEGASYGKAGASALISAGAEIFSEKLFGGSGLGEKGLINTEALTRGISNKVLKTLADFGVDIVSEGAEEVVSEIFSNLGTALYKEESLAEILASEEALQAYLDSFIGGAIMGGVANTSKAFSSTLGKAYKAAKEADQGKRFDWSASTDYRNGLTASEQKVFDSVYENTVKEAQEKNGKLTKKDKAALYDRVMEDVKKGYISPETIEKTMGGEAYEQYQKLVNESEEFNDLYETPYEKLSQKQRDRLAELTEKNKANSYDDAISNAYENLKNQVTDGGNSFKESYAERGRRGQSFQADVSKYDEKYRSTVQKAIDSGILNNTNRSHEFVDLVAKACADTGTQFDFANNKKLAESGLALEGITVNGVTTGDGVIINMDSAKALNTVVGHEITHILEGTDLYNALQTAIFDYAKGKGEFYSRRATLEKLYKGVEGADIDAELTADLVGDYLFTDKAFLQNLSTQHRNVFQKIYDQIKHLCKLATAGSKEARQLEEVKKAFEEVYREAGQGTKNTADDGGVKYSIAEIVDEDGNSYGVGVHLDSTLLDNLTPKERVEMVKEYIKELGGKSFTGYDANGNAVDISIAEPDQRFKNKNGKNTPVNKDLSTKYIGNEVKQESITLIDELIATAEYQSQKQPNYSHGWLDGNGQNNWEYWQTYVQDKGGEIWQATLNVANASSGEKILYDVNPIKKVGQSVKSDTSTVNNSISNSGENVNTKFSLSDSQGRKLSNDQVEYFRNAKTVDENGNLKLFYHGTARADRVGYYFNPERATSGPMAYFTDSKKIADNYARDKADTSLAYDEAYDDYYTQFRMNVNGKDVSVSEAWKQLPYAKRNEIREKAKHITVDDDYSGVIYDENAKYGPGGLDAYTINAHKGNVLEALTDAWLESGTIYGEEQMFLDVLKLAGLENVQYMNPDFRVEKTYEVYLNITNPFDASNISTEMVEKLKAAAEDAEYKGGNSADMWDKRNIEPTEWVERLERDIENGTTHAWTSIPDFVTETLKANGYDGIFDKGGKNGGEIHTVAIPFYSEQIKDIDNRTPTINPDIRYSLSPEGEQGSQYGDYNVYGEDVTRLAWDDIAPPTEGETQATDDIAPPVETAQNAETLLGDDIAPPVENKTAVGDDIAPTMEEIARMDAQNNDLGDVPIDPKVNNAANEDKHRKNADPKTQKKLDRIDAVVEVDKQALEAERQQKLKNLGQERDFVQKRAGELFGEIYYYQKGNKISKQLSEFLDISGGNWAGLKTIFSNIKYNPDLQVNANSSLENLVRKTLSDEYNDRIYDIDDEYQRNLKAIEKKATTDKENVGVAQQRRAKMDELTSEITELVGDISTWVDKKLGLQYQTSTLKRNLRDTVRDAEGNRDIQKADAIYEYLQGTYNANEANLKRESAKIKKKYADLKITKAESTYIQMLGEFKYNPDTELTADVVQDFYKNNKSKIDTAKVDKVIEMARPDYYTLLKRVNAVLREYGMREIPYRQGYFPHFTETKQGWFAKLMNWKVRDDSIPTNIAGMTEDFKPNRSWQSFNKQRTTDVTDYDFLKGLDAYSHGALDWIYHIGDIQRRRSFENYIRYTHSDTGVQNRINEILANDALDADQVQAEIDQVWAEKNNPLNNFVTDLRTGTNTLAGKKSSMDRGMESATNRKVYSTMTNLSNRVSANMVAGSISSALTNFIPITQSWGEVSPKYTLQAMRDTLKNSLVDDGIVDRSDFLTNRLNNEENLSKTTWDKVGEKVGWLMENVDGFTSQVVWRSKYLQNLAEGMTENAAMQDANNYAEGLMAGRSRGNMPTIFESKNPLIKIATLFQLESANQFEYMGKDMVQNIKGDTKAEKVKNLAKGYASMFIGAYVYNALYSALTGRDAAFDPIGIIEDLVKSIRGELDEDDEDRDWASVITGLGEDILEETPYIGGLLGGGRIPIASAIPYGSVTDMVSGTLGDLEDRDWENLTAEWLNLLYYGVMPMGGGQLRKTVQGLSMFDDDLPTSGSYTTGGDLRFPVEDTLGNRVQAALFGQWASENAQDYLEQGKSPLSEKRTEELLDLGVTVQEYWDMRKDMSKIESDKDAEGNTISGSKKKKVVQYIDGLDLTAAQKVTLYNGQYESEKDQVLEKLTTDFDDEDYWTWLKGLSSIESDKDANGKTVANSRKKKVVALLNSLDYLEYGQKIVLFRSEFTSDDTYCEDIVEYINGLNMKYADRVEILKALNFRISDDGSTVYWD